MILIQGSVWGPGAQFRAQGLIQGQVLVSGPGAWFRGQGLVQCPSARFGAQFRAQVLGSEARARFGAQVLSSGLNFRNVSFLEAFGGNKKTNATYY